MLVLTMKPGIPVTIGDDIVIHLLRTNENTAKVGFEAPKDVSISRANAKSTPDQKSKTSP